MLDKYNRLRQGYQQIDHSYKQYWLNININISYEDAYEYIENEGIINEITYLSSFLEQFKVVTRDQIFRYFKLGGFNSCSICLDTLVEYGFLNSFIIGLEGAIELSKDEVFYSIGVNTSLFMRKYLKLPVTRMLVKEISFNPQNLINRFDLTDFYLNYISSYGVDSIEKVCLKPLRVIGYDIIKIEAEFIVKENENYEHLIIINASRDTVDTLLIKTIAKLEKFIELDKSSTVYPGNGKNVELIILCENQKILEYVAKKLVITSFAKESKLSLISIDYLLRVNLSEYNIAYSVDQEGNVIEKKFVQEVL